MTNNIKTFRKAKKLTQAELGDLVGLAPSSISQLEAGNVNLSLNTLSRLVKELECDPCDLFPELGQYSKMHSQEMIRVFSLWQGLDQKARDGFLCFLEHLNGHHKKC